MSEGRQQVRGSSLLVLGRLAAMVLGMATQVLIVRYLTKSDYGAFAYALPLGMAARTFLSLGQGRLLSRFLATYEEERDYPRMFGSLVWRSERSSRPVCCASACCTRSVMR